jgi:hypothetical protein
MKQVLLDQMAELENEAEQLPSAVRNLSRRGDADDSRIHDPRKNLVYS